MVLTSWLPIWNMALDRLSKPRLPSADLTGQTTPEARQVSLHWDSVLGKVLADHDILVAVKTVFLGQGTTEFTPQIPQGATELTTGRRRLYYFQLPAYDAGGSPAAGTVPFDIVRTIELSTGTVFEPRGKKLFVPFQVSMTNVYATVVARPTFTEAAPDDAFCRALAWALAMQIAPPLSGKDRYRDAKLQDDYDRDVADCRYYNTTQGSDYGEPGWWSKLSETEDYLR